MLGEVAHAAVIIPVMRRNCAENVRISPTEIRAVVYVLCLREGMKRASTMYSQTAKIIAI